LLGSAIRRFPKEKWPLRLLVANAAQAVDLVASARAHVAVVALDAPPLDLESTRLRVVRQKLVVTPAHRLARRARAKIEDLEGERIVVAPEGSPHRTMLAHALGAAGVAWQVSVEATGWELMMQFAKYGVGVAVVNDFCTPPAGTVAVPLSGTPPIAYWAIARRGPRSAGAAALYGLVTS
jgi:DNA-binding transcriptional LysR family regulator